MPIAMPNNTAEPSQDAGLLRLQRKRARDRNSQRQARERTKSRLSYMESLVNEMTARDGSGSTGSLLRELTQVKQERDQLAKALDNMADIITSSRPSQQPDVSSSASTSTTTTTQRGHKDRAVRGRDAANIALSTSHNGLLNDDNAFDHDRELEPAPQSILPQSADCQQVPMEPRVSDPQFSLLQTTRVPEEQLLSLAGAFSSSRSQPVANIYPVEPVADLSRHGFDPIFPSSGTMCECNAPPQTRHPFQKSLWRSTNDVFLNTFQLGYSGSNHAEEEMDEDLMVRAVVDGWDAAMEYWNLTHLPPCWQILRGLDEVLFAHDSNKLQRLANIKLVHLRLRFLLAPSPGHLVKIPPWYHRRCDTYLPTSFLPLQLTSSLFYTNVLLTSFNRPSQEMPHSCAIDYIPW